MLLLTSMIAANMNHYFYDAGLRPRWQEAADYVRRHYQPGEKIIFNTVWLGEYYLSDLGVKIISSPDALVDVDHPFWIVTRKKKNAFLKKHPALSQAQLQTTFVSNNTLGEKYKLDVYYLPPVSP